MHLITGRFKTIRLDLGVCETGDLRLILGADLLISQKSEPIPWEPEGGSHQPTRIPRAAIDLAQGPACLREGGIKPHPSISASARACASA